MWKTAVIFPAKCGSKSVQLRFLRRHIHMHGIFAQSESESLSGNVRMGKAMSAKKGNVPFCYKSFLGYRRGADNQPEIDPEQAKIVRLIFDRYLAGDSLIVIKPLSTT